MDTYNKDEQLFIDNNLELAYRIWNMETPPLWDSVLENRIAMIVKKVLQTQSFSEQQLTELKRLIKHTKLP